MEMRASHILIKNKAAAEAVLRKLKGGSSFTALAKEFSACPSKGKGGDLGWFKPGQMVPAFERAVKKMANGSVSRLVKTNFGYHIIKKTGQR